MTLRVGTVPYLVGRPIDAGLASIAGIELEHAVPARLVEGLRDGSIDVALVSSIELFRRPGYGYLDGPAVCGRGFVSSVQLFLNRPLPDVRRVILDPASRTAQALVRVTLCGELGRDALPTFEEIPLGADPMSRMGEAWLEIGDAALRRHLAPDAPPVFNPSEAWSRQTGLPFVFAAWIVRPGVEIEPRHLDAFRSAHGRNADRIEAWSRAASERWKLPFEACRRYLSEECLYELGDELTPALTTFRDRASALDLCDGALAPTPIPLR